SPGSDLKVLATLSRKGRGQDTPADSTFLRGAAVACLAVLAFAVVGVAAPPAPSAKTSGGAAVNPAPSGALVRSDRPFGPRGAAFVTSLNPDARGAARALPPAPPPEVRIPDAYEMIVFANHRPIRVRITVTYEGKTVAERWTETLRRAFDYFD